MTAIKTWLVLFLTLHNIVTDNETEVLNLEDLSNQIPESLEEAKADEKTHLDRWVIFLHYFSVQCFQLADTLCIKFYERRAEVSKGKGGYCMWIIATGLQTFFVKVFRYVKIRFL